MLPRAVIGLMRDSITVKVKTNDDKYGSPVFTSDTCRGRVVYGSHKVLTPKNVEAVSSVQVILAKDYPTLTIEGSITLPDGTSPKLLSIQRHKWPNGTYFIQVFM